MNKKGIKESFKPFQYGPNGPTTCEVIPFNDDMAICALHGEGPVIITKEQVMAFFDLVPADQAFKQVFQTKPSPIY